VQIILEGDEYLVLEILETEKKMKKGVDRVKEVRKN
jgi:hypothetical protein